MPIGGAEERTKHGVILHAFVDLAGRDQARIVVLPTASSDPTAGQDYIEIFRQIGATTVELASINSREEANGDAMVALLAEATGIFITGGDQARLSKLVVGTRAMEAIRATNARGAVVAGTSAGASILGAHMMAGGESETPPYKGLVEVVAGFGLLQDIIVDQHFSTRGRIGRLLTVFSANPGLVAFGIDEDTAVVVGPDGLAKAIGTKSVTVVDGRDVYSDYHDRADGEILTITGSSLHVLAPGRIFDLRTRHILHLRQDQTAVAIGEHGNRGRA